MRKHPPRMKLTRCELPSAAQLHLPSQPRSRAGSSHTLLRPVQPKGAPRMMLSPCPGPALTQIAGTHSSAPELMPSDFILAQLCPTSLLTARLEQRSGRAAVSRL